MRNINAVQNEYYSLSDIVAGNIRAEVARIGWSQSEFARKIGMKQALLNNRWLGKTAWGLDDIEAVADVLNIDPADLLRLPRIKRNARRLASVPDSYTARDLNPEPSDSDSLQLAPIVKISDYAQRMAG